jgi:hypothetical protein
VKRHANYIEKFLWFLVYVDFCVFLRARGSRCDLLPCDLLDGECGATGRPWVVDDLDADAVLGLERRLDDLLKGSVLGTGMRKDGLVEDELVVDRDDRLLEVDIDAAAVHLNVLGDGRDQVRRRASRVGVEGGCACGDGVLADTHAEQRLAVLLGHLVGWLGRRKVRVLGIGVHDDVDITRAGTGLALGVDDDGVSDVGAVLQVLTRYGTRCMSSAQMLVVAVWIAGMVLLAVQKTIKHVVGVHRGDVFDDLLHLLVGQEVRVGVEDGVEVRAENLVTHRLELISVDLDARGGLKVLDVLAEQLTREKHDGHLCATVVGRGGGTPLREVGAALGQNDGIARHVALQLRERDDCVHLLLKNRGGQEDEGLDGADLVAVGLAVLEQVAAHTAEQTLDDRVRLRSSCVLPHEADVRLGHDLARAQTALDEDHGRLLRRVLHTGDRLALGSSLTLLSLSNGDLVLVLGVLEEVEPLTAAQGAQDVRHVDGLLALGGVNTEHEVLAGEALHERLQAVLPVRREEVERLVDETVRQVALDAVVGRGRREHLDVLGLALAVEVRGKLRVGRCVHREDERVVGRHLGRGAVEVETVCDKELVHLLVDGLIHVRLVHHDEGVLDVHGALLELGAEEDSDLVRHVAVVLEKVRHRLLLQRDLARAAEDVGALDDAVLQHRADDVVVGAGLAGLDVRPEEGVADHPLTSARVVAGRTRSTSGKYIDDVLSVGALLLGDEDSVRVDSGTSSRRPERVVIEWVRRHLGRK